MDSKLFEYKYLKLSSIREFKDRFQNYFNKPYDLLIYVDAQYNVVALEKTCEEVLGVDRNYLINNKLSSKFKILEFSNYVNLFQEISKDNNGLDSDFVAPNKNLVLVNYLDDKIKLNVTSLPYFFEENLIGYCLICKKQDQTILADSNIFDEMMNFFKEFSGKFEFFFNEIKNINKSKNFDSSYKENYLRYIVKKFKSQKEQLVDNHHNLDTNSKNNVYNTFDLNQMYDSFDNYAHQIKNIFYFDRVVINRKNNYSDYKVLVFGHKSLIYKLLVTALEVGFDILKSGEMTYEYNILEDDFSFVDFRFYFVGQYNIDLRVELEEVLELVKILSEMLLGDLKTSLDEDGFELVIRIPFFSQIRIDYKEEETQNFNNIIDVIQSKNNVNISLDFLSIDYRNRKIAMVDSSQFNYFFIANLLSRTQITIENIISNELIFSYLQENKDISLIILEDEENLESIIAQIDKKFKLIVVGNSPKNFDCDREIVYWSLPLSRNICFNDLSRLL